MKVVSYSSARCVALFSIEAFAPLERVSERVLFKDIRDRYEFTRTPDLRMSREQLADGGLVFETGVHDGANIHTFAVHNDGLVVNTATTVQGDAFLNDLLEWLIETNGFRQVSMKRLYISEIVVDFETPLEKLFSAHRLLSEVVMRHVGEDNRAVTGAKPFRLDFGFEAGRDMPRFILEKRVNSAFSDERYLSSAPLTTTHHLEVLRDLEKLLA